MSKSSLVEQENRKQRLLGLLRSETFWITSHLARELNISLRTLMRDLSSLKEQGYPLETERGRGGGVRLNDRWGISKLHLNHLEVINLLVSLAITEKLNSPLLTSESRSISQKIAISFPPAQRQVISELRKRILTSELASQEVMQTYGKVKNQVTKVISHAFFEKKKLDILYQTGDGRKTQRTIEPHFLLLNWPIWYILAWDCLREDIRVFRIDRFIEAKLEDEHFKLRNSDLFLKEYQEYFRSI